MGPPRGSEPSYRRPAIVVQRDELNRSQLATVVICLLTTNLKFAHLPGNALIRKRASGLPHDSIANGSQLATVDKNELDSLVGLLPPSAIEQVENAVRFTLALDR